VQPVFEQIKQEWIQSGRYPPAIQQMWAKRVTAEPLATGYSPERETFSRSLAVVIAVVGLILLIACVNVAALLLAKSSSRQREMAVRHALGAGTTRIIRQLLTESLLLSSTGGAIGILLGISATTSLSRFMASGPAAFLGSEGAPPSLALTLDLRPDWRVVAFSVGLCLLTGLLFGLAPAFQGTKTPSRALSTRVSAASSGTTLRKTLVIAEVALDVVLLVGAGLLSRTLQNLKNQDLGFDRRQVLLIWTNPFEVALSGAPLQNLWKLSQERLSSLPGVQSVSVSNMGLLNGYPALTGSEFYAVPGQAPKSGRHLVNQKVTPGFFDTVGIKLVQGRDFNGFDTDVSPPVVILNETLARFYFGDQSPVGKRLDFVRPHNFPPYTVVGVVRDTKNSLREENTGAIFYPSGQTYFGGAQTMVVAVRTMGNPLLLEQRARQELYSVNPELPILKIDTIDQQIDSVVATERLLSAFATFFGTLAVALTCIGLYGVISHTVSRRTNEIGVRMALGAVPVQVLRGVLQECMSLAAAGVTIGVVAALATTRFIATLLFGLSPSDPLTLVSAAVLITVVAAAAGFIPAWRASRVDPLVALHYE
jgi:predicted permease